MRIVRLAQAVGSRVAVVAVVVGAVVLVGPVAAWAAGDANQPTCPFETEASPGFRTYLPDCRAYELVTPPYKEGGLVEVLPAAIASDGERLIAGVPGAFAASGNEWPNQNRNPDFAVYEFARTGEGWRPTALTPPATQYPHSAIMAASAADGLQTTLWSMASVATRTLRFNEDIYLREPGGTFAEVGPGVAPEVAGEELAFVQEELDFAGASSNLGVLLFSISVSAPTEREAHKGHSNVWPGDTTNSEKLSLYEYVTAGAPDSEPILVGVKNEAPILHNTEARVISRCGTELGSGVDAYNAVSEDGETVFFTASACGGPSEPTVNELYARVDGASTTAISEPTAADCSVCNTTSGLHNAVFQGASQNGEKVFFLTEQELLAGQKGMNLYEYDFNGPEHAKISLVSGGSTEPKVQGVVRVSDNGERVYFVAKGKLAGINAEEKEPEEEADNLYVYDTQSHSLRFVATLLTPTEETALGEEEATEKEEVKALALLRAEAAALEALSHGASFFEAYVEVYDEVEKREEKSLPGTLGPGGTLAEDTSVWRAEDRRPAQATADGHFLLFSSSADLTPGDHSKVPQLFEYDAVKQTLSRTSIGQGGSYSDNGNVSTFAEAPLISEQKFVRVDLPTAESFGAALSGDGSRVFFTSAARLVPQAVTGATNVYEYREGNVYLISDGRDASVDNGSPTVQVLGVDPSGTNVFFLSADPLVPQDNETQVVVYDAREAGGFPAPLVSPGCIGETCRGLSGSTPQLQLPGSASQAGGDNLPPPVESKPAAKSKPKPLTRAQKLAKALKACKSQRNKQKRASCKAKARKAFAAKSARRAR